MIEITVREEEHTQEATPILVVPIPSGERTLDGAVASVDGALDGLVSRLRSSGEYKGTVGETLLVHTFGRIPAERVILVGLGDVDTLTVSDARQAGASAARAARQARVDGFSMLFPQETSLEMAEFAGALVEGVMLGLYRFDVYRGIEGVEPHVEPHVEPQSFSLIVAKDRDVVEAGVRRGREVAAGVALARDLINEPPNVLTPSELTRRAAAMAEEHGIECTILSGDRLREMGMEALLGVAAGSAEPPAFIVLRYGPSEGVPIALVGKGITFDSGGISIKPAENMHHMKGDMGGAAAVLGAMRTIAALDVKVPVVGLIATSENLLGDKAQRPGDIVRAMNGVTIEVINTDAEGRLVLADALSYAVREGFSPLVDVATLTGAAVVALGPHYSAFFANDEALADEVSRAARDGGESVWRMPLDPAYEKLIKSDVAEIKNTGGRAGGAITAAMFLQHFVGTTPWAHFDIAATSWSESDEGERTKGGTGVQVRTLVKLVEGTAR